MVSTTPKDQPHFAEQGKEHDDLVKVKGEWMIKKRIITSTGGLAPTHLRQLWLGCGMRGAHLHEDF